MIVYDSRGNKFTTQPLAGSGNSGNEGEVFAVVGNPDFVIKIFHKDDIAQVNNRTEERYNKLKAMLNNVPVDQTLNQYGYRSFTFPVDIIYDSTLQNKDTFLGYLMPKIPHDCKGFTYSIIADKSLREPAFENILIRTLAAQNLAGLVRHFHSKAYVIGDINRSNLFIGTGANTAGFVTLIDIDSIQVLNPNGGFYRSTVGFPDYTPPELQGINLRTIDRTIHHDNFILAIFIFQLLMDGFHPFQGGDHPNEVLNIKHNSSFINNIYPQKYPTGCPDFAILPPNIRTLFLKCFNHGFTDPSVRPTAKEWKRVLTNYSNSLRKCSQNRKHYYGEHLSQCPWCGSVPKKKAQSANGSANTSTSLTGQVSLSGGVGSSGASLYKPTQTHTNSQNKSNSPQTAGSALYGNAKSTISNPNHNPYGRSRHYQPNLAGNKNIWRLAFLLILFGSLFTPWVLPSTAGFLAPINRSDAQICINWTDEDGTLYYETRIPKLTPNTFSFRWRETSPYHSYGIYKIGASTWFGSFKESGLFKGKLGEVVLINKNIHGGNTDRWRKGNDGFYGILVTDSYTVPLAISPSRLECNVFLAEAEKNKVSLFANLATYRSRSNTAVNEISPFNLNPIDRNEVITPSAIQSPEKVKTEFIKQAEIEIARQELVIDREAQRRSDRGEITAFERNETQADRVRFFVCLAHRYDIPSDYVHRHHTGSSDLLKTDIYADSQSFTKGVDLILREKEVETVSSSEKYYKYAGKMYSNSDNSIDENLYVIYIRKDGVRRNIGISKDDNNITQNYIAIARTRNDCTSNLTYAINSYSTQLNAWARSATSKY